MFLLSTASGASAMTDCGDAQTPCEVEGGSYHAAIPEGVERPPIVLFLHGAGGTGVSSVRNPARAARYTDRGYALIAPQGLRGAKPNRDWGVRDGAPQTRDDIAFLNRVLDDAAERFGLDRDRVLAAGFSRGGSMIWDLACLAPDTATAYAAVAGAFWEPMHEGCEAAVHLHHTHGFSDPMVPFEGRVVSWQGRSYHQGNVMKGLDVWRQGMGCMARAVDTQTDGNLWRKEWPACSSGSLTLLLGPGGHGVPRGWLGEVLDWFEGLPQPGDQG